MKNMNLIIHFLPMKNKFFFDLKFNIIFLVYFLIVSCTDDKVIMIPEQEITQTSSDYIKCEVYFNSIVYEIEKGFSSNVSSRTFPIYINHNLNPLNEDTLIIDYGNSNTLINGKFFRGRIINIYSGSVNDTNFNCSSNFDNFYLNNNLINGTITIDNNEGEIQIINGEVTDISGKINWNSIQIRTQSHGLQTVNIEDDKFTVNSLTTGNGKNNINFSTKSDSLKIRYDCVESCLVYDGISVINVEMDDVSKKDIIFGSQSCSCNYNVIINGNSYPLYLD